MHRFYKIPVLLIEFDDEIPFKLVDPNFETSFISGGELTIVSILSKLSMLALNFPNL